MADSGLCDGAQPMGGFRTGPKLDAQTLDRFAGIDRAGTRAPTWRGWVIGLLGVAFLAWATPIVEFSLSGSLLSINLLPTGPLILLVLLLLFQWTVHKLCARSMLSREDFTLATSMCFVSASLSGYGFMAYVTGAMAGPTYFARPENDWQVTVMPYLPEWLVPHDPLDPNSPDPRPVEWFMTGLPPGRSIPWSAWMVPYAYWALMALCVFAMMFAVCAMLRKHWADRERLPFPLVQVPLEVLAALPGAAERKKPFLCDRTAQVGIAIPFLLHSWNSLGSYVANWPTLPLQFRYLNLKYMSEAPWKAFGPLHIYIFPAVIGLTYLISLEVSFSIWFFYLLMKLCAFAAVQMGLGSSHEDFYDVGGNKGFMIDQGGGALIAMVLFGLWMSRTYFADMLLRAVGIRPLDEEEDEGLSPRAAVVLFAVGFAGAILWLIAAGFAPGIALLTVVSLVLILTGVTRLACESGLFYVQSQIAPAEILNVVFTPLGLGPHTVVPLGLWSRIFVFDWGRTSPMPGMMHALKLSSDLQMRKAPLVVGVAASLLLALAIGFYSFLNTAFTSEGGALGFEGGHSWTMGILPQEDVETSSNKVAQILAYEQQMNRRFARFAAERRFCTEEQAQEQLRLAEQAFQDRVSLYRCRNDVSAARRGPQLLPSDCGEIR